MPPWLRNWNLYVIVLVQRMPSVGRQLYSSYSGAVSIWRLGLLYGDYCTAVRMEYYCILLYLRSLYGQDSH